MFSENPQPSPQRPPIRKAVSARNPVTHPRPHVSGSMVERDISSIMMTAALVNDIGNPPFGHFGETVIKDYFKRYL